MKTYGWLIAREQGLPHEVAQELRDEIKKRSTATGITGADLLSAILETSATTGDRHYTDHPIPPDALYMLFKSLYDSHEGYMSVILDPCHFQLVPPASHLVATTSEATSATEPRVVSSETKWLVEIYCANRPNPLPYWHLPPAGIRFDDMTYREKLKREIEREMGETTVIVHQFGKSEYNMPDTGNKRMVNIVIPRQQTWLIGGHWVCGEVAYKAARQELMESGKNEGAGALAENRLTDKIIMERIIPIIATSEVANSVFANKATIANGIDSKTKFGEYRFYVHCRTAEQALKIESLSYELSKEHKFRDIFWFHPEGHPHQGLWDETHQAIKENPVKKIVIE